MAENNLITTADLARVREQEFAYMFTGSLTKLMEALGITRKIAKTAEAVGRHLGLTPILRTELREGNLGKACGKSVQWLRENLEQPEKTVDDRLILNGYVSPILFIK